MKALLADVYLSFFVTSARTEIKVETKTEAKAEVKKNESSDENDEDADDDKCAAEEADIRDVKYRLEPLASKTWLVASICSNQIRNQVRHDWQWTMEKYQDNIAGSTISLSKERTYPKRSQLAGEGHHMDFQPCNLVQFSIHHIFFNLWIENLWHTLTWWAIPSPLLLRHRSLESAMVTSLAWRWCQRRFRNQALFATPRDGKLAQSWRWTCWLGTTCSSPRLWDFGTFADHQSVPHFPQSLQLEQPNKGMNYPFRDLQVTSSVPHLGRAFTDVQELKQAWLSHVSNSNRPF